MKLKDKSPLIATFDLAFVKLMRETGGTSFQVPEVFDRVEMFLQPNSFKEGSYYRGMNLQPEGLLKILSEGFSKSIDVDTNVVTAGMYAFNLFPGTAVREFSPNGDLIVIFEVLPNSTIHSTGNYYASGPIAPGGINEVFLFDPVELRFKPLSEFFPEE